MTKEYLRRQFQNFKTVLLDETYATKEELENIDIGDIDLTGYAKTEDIPNLVEDAVENIPTLNSEKLKGLENNIDIISKNENLLQLEDGDFTGYGLTIHVEDNVITINGTLASNNKSVYLRLTNQMELQAEATSGSGMPSEWFTENVDFLKVGKTYGMNFFNLSGSTTAQGVISSGRGATPSDKLLKNNVLTTLADNIRVIALYLNHEGRFNNYKVAVAINENEIPTTYEGRAQDIIALKDYWKSYVSSISLVNNAFIDVESALTTNEFTQGMCTDGTYLYVSAMDGTDKNNTFVGKYKLSDGTLVNSVEDYNLGHCNSMAYNPITNKIYCLALDSVGTVHVINTDLTYDTSFVVDLSDIYPPYEGIRGITYNINRKQFLCVLRGANRRGHVIFDSDFNFEDLIWVKNLSGTYGAIDTDGNYIYQIMYNPSRIEVFAFNGKYIGSVAIPNIGTDEPEEIVVNGDDVYINVSRYANGRWSTFVEKFNVESNELAFVLKI